jgi:uncharacterized protein DUF6350
MSYAIGPGFSVGAETSVSPAGVFLNAVPAFPPFAALPEPGPAPLLSLFALAAPFLAGAVGGTLTVRTMPSPVYEAAPLWGFVSGALTGCVAAVLAALSGGPLGGGRLVTMGPSAWQVGLLATLEVGVSAAVAAWVANWVLLRRPAPTPASAPTGGAEGAAGTATTPPPIPEHVAFVEPEPVLAVRRPKPPARKGTAAADVPAPEVPAAVDVPAPRREPDPRERERPAEPEPGRSESGEPERVENRGGAIYVLRNEPPPKS